MKYFVLILIASAQLSCATKSASATENNSMKDIIEKKQPVYFEHTTIDEAIDFTSILEPHQISEGVYQVSINSGITFKKCVFNKPVNAYKKMDNGDIVITSFYGNVSFIDCVFKEGVNFRGSVIHGRTDFTGSFFKSDVNFEELSCHENAFFNACVFEGSLRFQNSFFNQKTNFIRAKFYDNVSFQNSVFNSELQCSATEFYKYADFTLIDCRGKVFFNYADFRDKGDFSHSICVQDFNFVSTKSNSTSFNNSRFLGITSFNNIEVSSQLNFEGIYFLMDTPEVDIPSEKLLH